MFWEHWFWGLLTVAALTWYSTVTIYVTFRGAIDIKKMLARLEKAQQQQRE